MQTMPENHTDTRTDSPEKDDKGIDKQKPFDDGLNRSFNMMRELINFHCIVGTHN